MTRSSTPLFKGNWLKKGVHINAVGSNSKDRREIDSIAVENANIIITDSLEQARYESGDLIFAESEGINVWHKTYEISDLLIKKIEGRKSEEEITLFKSNGIAIEDLAVASYVYKVAIKSNIGKRLDI